jgi:hypothetical protein
MLTILETMVISSHSLFSACKFSLSSVDSLITKSTDIICGPSYPRIKDQKVVGCRITSQSAIIDVTLRWDMQGCIIVRKSTISIHFSVIYNHAIENDALLLCLCMSDTLSVSACYY